MKEKGQEGIPVPEGKLFKHAFFFPKAFQARMKRSHDPVNPFVYTHRLKGFLLPDHVLQTFIGVNQRKEIIDEIRGSL